MTSCSSCFVNRVPPQNFNVRPAPLGSGDQCRGSLAAEHNDRCVTQRDMWHPGGQGGPLEHTHDRQEAGGLCVGPRRDVLSKPQSGGVIEVRRRSPVTPHGSVFWEPNGFHLESWELPHRFLALQAAERRLAGSNGGDVSLIWGVR